MPYRQNNGFRAHGQHEGNFHKDFSGMSEQIPVGEVPPLPKSIFQDGQETAASPQSLYFNILKQRQTHASPSQQNARSSPSSEGRSISNPGHESMNEPSTPSSQRSASGGSVPLPKALRPTATRSHSSRSVPSPSHARPQTPTSYYPSYERITPHSQADSSTRVEVQTPTLERVHVQTPPQSQPKTHRMHSEAQKSQLQPQQLQQPHHHRSQHELSPQNSQPQHPYRQQLSPRGPLPATHPMVSRMTIMNPDQDIDKQRAQIPLLRNPNSEAALVVPINSLSTKQLRSNALHIQTQTQKKPNMQYSQANSSSGQKAQLYPTEDTVNVGVAMADGLPQQDHRHHHHQRQHFGSFNGSSTMPNSQGIQVGQSRKSPILRQSLSFLRGNRSASSSSLASDYAANADMEKYHLVNGKTMTTNGRVLPQRLEMRGSIKDRASKSRSFSSLTRRIPSGAFLRNSGDKERIYSTGSLGSRISSLPEPQLKSSVYPAVLSQVAKAFRDSMQLGARYKNGLEYRDAFTGVEAVDVIARIIRTSDRNLALLLGRSLDAQKFFHDVTYEHRLRDSSNEVYQFSEDVFSPYTDSQQTFNRQNSVASSSDYTDTENTMPPSMATPTTAQQSSATVSTGINGVFTLLTECYSPTCSRDNLCYSIACPRRLEQQARLGSKTGSLARSDSRLSFTQEEQKPYWQLTVPKTVLDSLDKREIKRQECIFETIYSERDFVKDLEYMREFWIRPLSETKIIKPIEREHFVNTVFFGINDIWEVSSKFAEAMTKRQQEQHVVKEVGDLFLEFIPRFESFIKYGAGQVMGRYEFDRQKRHNPFFVRFIEDTSNRAESRRLDLSSYLSKPTTRPARYPLLLKSIRNHTDPKSKDYENLGKAIEMLQKMLTRINFETGKASDRLNLFLLKQKLVFRPGELVDLKLTGENRKLLYQCILKKRNYQDKDRQGEVQVYIFDHALLMVKVKVINKREVYRVYQRPIPIPLLFLSLSEESPTLKVVKNTASTGTSAGSTTSLLGQDQLPPGNFQLASTTSKSPMSFTYIGRNGYKLTLYATPAVQRMLAERIESQSKKLIEDNDVFTLTPLSSDFFDASNKINCVVPFDGGRKLLYGTDAGIYMGDVKIDEDNHRTVSKPVKIIGKINIIQADILGEYQMLLALSDKKMFYWPLDVLKSEDSLKNAKLGKELMNHVSFFKVGVCSGRMLVCAAKSSSNMIRVFEPIDPINQKKQRKKFVSETKDVTFGSEPVSVSFLKTKLCVGCSKGFEIVSLDSNVMEQLLDPADTSLDFAIGREGLKPLEIDRINSDFLLSYSSFSFFINHNGWRSRSKWIIHWEGVPHAFALWYPYLLAFDSNMIEIRHVETGELLRVIVAENIRFLHSSSQEILYAYEDERGYDVVASLDFWDKSMKNIKSGSKQGPIPLPSQQQQLHLELQDSVKRL
ncbi:hypothetical protein FOA43_003959 [Brettanomyces nanus]|uniref:Uncharacterized protein n=1 Tax=Eeniella nana TaxID=13502 RepID=A0A875S6J2_EENNA|nr:uncharacterized protein FOA43_003959 [Brettanomyces nanus]QPG76568.1 hypothetical protein FOA43_003959 [Brettanomyces nanus]